MLLKRESGRKMRRVYATNHYRELSAIKSSIRNTQVASEGEIRTILGLLYINAKEASQWNTRLLMTA